MNKLLIICGPTATGKTALALTLAQQLSGELVSADSRQIYRGMDIGTGKDADVCAKEGVPLWMIDVVNPDDEFSVRHYQLQASTIITDIQARGKLPIIVGGTGLYIQSLIQPIETSSIPPDQHLRNELSSLSRSELQQRVEQQLPAVWASLNHSDRNNPRRLIRKIELGQKNIRSSGIFFDTDIGKPAVTPHHTIGLKTVNAELYKRIDTRVDMRVRQGILQEIQQLLDKGYDWTLHSMSSLGYREWREYFTLGRQPKEDVIQQWKFDEHGYARRQLTWFNKQKDIHWFDVGVSGWEDEVQKKVRQWYTARSI